MTNRLALATSPYLRQHADNPVDWWEWSDEAFAAARGGDVPVLLSVGYATCHWCHVMAHESFEDEATAAYMNQHFVSIKVDREERPDVDRIYMDAVTAMTGRGGWPMTVFLTPDAKPIFAGTYYPKTSMGHHPSFMHVMEAVVDAWQTNREGAAAQADSIAEAIAQHPDTGTEAPSLADIDQAIGRIHATFDRVNGGFGTSPKFPQAPTLELLLRRASMEPSNEASALSKEMLVRVLHAMADGGINDHLFGGFARYSVDAQWLIPHFEKMLYDNAQLARLYLRAWQLTGVERFLEVARTTFDYLDTVMADPVGGLHSGEDADSEGEEGKFAVWSWGELAELLGPDLPIAASIYGFTETGNFEGSNNPHRQIPLLRAAEAVGLDEQELTAAKDRVDATLIAARRDRVAPSRDDKIVTSWNGLAMRSFAEAGAILGDARYLERAERIASFLADTSSPDGTLVHSWRDRPGHAAFAEDHAAVAVGYFTLYSVTMNPRWFELGESSVAELRERFAADGGGFYATASDSSLIARPFNVQDSPAPSDNSMAMEALLMHAAFTGEQGSGELLEETMARLAPAALRYPSFGAYALAIWLTHLTGVDEVAIVGSEAASMSKVVWDTYRPQVVLAATTQPTDDIPLLAHRTSGGGTMAYVCRGHVCDLPVNTDLELADRLSHQGVEQ
ncbi:MAG: thioredoxin domain-containing protein [Acidimicrobiia bacterium]